VSATAPHFVCEGGALVGPALMVHGGAGTFARLRDEATRAHLQNAIGLALDAGWAFLVRGEDALPAAVEAVACLEDSGLFNAGRGSTPTSEGKIEMDAGVMDGVTGTAGAICAGTWPANPVRAALAVARLSITDASTPALPPVAADVPGAGQGRGSWQPLLLAGVGADRLAEAAGLARMTSPGSPAATAPGTHDGTAPGTVGAVALDQAGHLAAATSTGGRAGQPPGRVGDSCIIGAGTWADDSTIAISGTGTGEAFILAGFAHRVDWAMRSGQGIECALRAAMNAVSARNGNGGAIALAPSGRFAAIFGTPAMARGWRSGSEVVVRI